MQAQVLFVSEDADLRAVATRVLERDGYKVSAASHSGHALLSALSTPVDILVAELSSPEMSGPALADSLRRLHPEMKAVFMGQPGTPDGIDHVVVRPFTRDDLLSRIELALCIGSAS